MEDKSPYDAGLGKLSKRAHTDATDVFSLRQELAQAKVENERMKRWEGIAVMAIGQLNKLQEKHGIDPIEGLSEEDAFAYWTVLGRNDPGAS